MTKQTPMNELAPVGSLWNHDGGGQVTVISHNPDDPQFLIVQSSAPDKRQYPMSCDYFREHYVNDLHDHTMTKHDTHDQDFIDLVFDVDDKAGKTRPFTHPAGAADFDTIAVALTGAALVLHKIIGPIAQRTIERHAIAHRRDAKRMRDADGGLFRQLTGQTKRGGDGEYLDRRKLPPLPTI